MIEFDLQLFADEEAGGGVLSSDDSADTSTSESGLLSTEETPEEKAEGVSEEPKDDKQENDKGGEDKPAEKESEDDKGEDKPEGAPEKYEDFKVPDGVTIDKSAADEFGALARELNLTQENAQKLVDYQIKFQQAQYAKLDEANQKQSREWANETLKAYKKDELADARRGFKSAPKEVQDMLAACGFDNHKSFVEFFMKVGKSIKEDKFEMGKGKGGTDRPTANVIYPELN